MKPFVGPIGDNFVLHRCDVRACYNPRHLFLGTQADNMTDMAKKGRGGKSLTREQVGEIRRVYNPTKYHSGTAALARRFGVGRNTIKRVARGITWRIDD